MAQAAVARGKEKDNSRPFPCTDRMCVQELVSVFDSVQTSLGPSQGKDCAGPVAGVLPGFSSWLRGAEASGGTILTRRISEIVPPAAPYGHPRGSGGWRRCQGSRARHPARAQMPPPRLRPERWLCSGNQRQPVSRLLTCRNHMRILAIFRQHRAAGLEDDVWRTWCLMSLCDASLSTRSGCGCRHGTAAQLGPRWRVGTWEARLCKAECATRRGASESCKGSRWWSVLCRHFVCSRYGQQSDCGSNLP